MNRSILRTCMVLVLGVVCLGALAVRLAGESQAAPLDKLALGPNRPESPAQSANVELINHLDGDFNSVIVQDHYAYIRDASSCFHIMDISDPVNPAEINSFCTPNSMSFDVSGSYAYVMVSADLLMVDMHIFSIADPANPIEVGVYTMSSIMSGSVWAHYPYVYITRYYWDPHGHSMSFYVVDVSDPENPTLVNQISPGMVNEIIFRDNYAYMSVYESDPLVPCDLLWGFGIYDVSDPGNPILISHGSVNKASDVAIAGSYGYLAGNSCADSIYNAIFIEDISDPYSPTRVNVLPGYYGGLEASSSYLYLGSGSDLYVISLANPIAPKEIGFYEMPVGIYDFKVAGGYIYVTAGTDGLYILRLTRAISGQVTDANRMPYPGVSIETSAGVSTTVSLDGYYTFTNVLTGTYLITPTMPGYVFQPASRSLVVPSYEALAADFTILPLPVTIILTPGLITTLTLTDTQGLTTALLLPAGAVSETMTITLTPTVGTDQLSWVFAGHAFELAAYQEGVLMPDLTFSVPVTVTIHYSDMDTHLVGDDSQLALWAWVGGGWQDAIQTCEPPAGYRRDEDGKILSLAICRVGFFKLMGPTYPVFLPDILLPQ